MAESLPAQRDLRVGDSVVETTPSGLTHPYRVSAVDVTPKNAAAPEGRYVVLSWGCVHHTMRQEDIFAVDWMQHTPRPCPNCGGDPTQDVQTGGDPCWCGVTLRTLT